MAGKIKQRTSTSHKSQRRRQFQDEPREFENIVPLNAQPFHKPQPIIAQNEAQKRYINAIRTQTITFASGPAGVGKTWLAGALAAEQLTGRKIEKIIITRPAVEAGEKLGFLPGEIEEKYAPYLAPFRDVLDERLGKSFVDLALKRGKIEAAPFAYMRGRTFKNALVILDEAQNTTPEQMKMFLTRIGIGAKAVVTGDITQIDLPRNQKSGLRHAIEVLGQVEGISFNFFQAADVVRHPVVARIVQAYEAYEEQQRHSQAAQQAARKFSGNEEPSV